MDLSVFIAVLRYAPMEQLKPFMEDHRVWAERYAAGGIFLLAGPMTSLDGGVIVARAASREQFESLLKEDPFYREGLETFDIIEFAPRRGALRMSPTNPLFLGVAEREKAFAPSVDWVDAIARQNQGD